MRDGRPLNWSWHCRRLAADAACIGLRAPDADVLRNEIALVSGAGPSVAKVIVTRGRGGRGYAPPLEMAPTRIVASFAWPEGIAEKAREGVIVRRCELTLGYQARFAGAKTLNRLENVLARAEWTDAAIAEGLLGDVDGHVIEGTMSNVFVVAHGRVATPRLDRCGVVGAQRERVRELLAGEGIACDQTSVRWESLESADEIFLTNSLAGAWPVRGFGARAWTPGPVTRRVQAMLEAADALA